MIPICDNCQYNKSDCKGNKSPEKIKCEYYKKPVVFNAKEAAERIAELEAIKKELEAHIEYLKSFAYNPGDVEEFATYCYYLGELGASKILEYLTSLFVKSGGKQ